MSRVLILSSFVAHGHVGLCAAAPALQQLGHTVSQLPTILLSNHPGWGQVSGAPVPVAQLHGMLNALDQNGWLGQLDAVLTGYLPSADHVAFAAALVDGVRDAAPSARVVVDPVLGDDPKGLYVDRAAAEAVRDSLIAKADVITPNLFELGWLAGAPVADTAGVVDAAARLGVEDVCVTSAPAPDGQIGVLRVNGGKAAQWHTPLRAGVPKGVGDVFAGLLAGGVPVGAALGHLSQLVDASLGADHLRVAEAAVQWVNAAPVAISQWKESEDGL